MVTNGNKWLVTKGLVTYSNYDLQTKTSSFCCIVTELVIVFNFLCNQGRGFSLDL